MAIRLFSDVNNQFFDDNGDPVALGTVKFTAVGDAADLVDTYPTRADAVAGTNANGTAQIISLDAAGRPSSGGNEYAIWLSGDCDVYIYDADDVLVRSLTKVNSDSATGGSNAELMNPSFEDGLEGTWEIYNSTGAAAVVTTDYVHETTAANVNHGAKALRLIGGAYAMSYDENTGAGALVAHSPDEDLIIQFSLYTPSTTDDAKITVRQWSAAAADLGADIDIYSATSGNPNAAYELKTGRIAAASLHANCRYVSLKLTGGAASSSEYAIFDGITLLSVPQRIFGTVTAWASLNLGDASHQDVGLTFNPSGTGATALTFKVAGWIKGGATNQTTYTSKGGVITGTPTAPGSNSQLWTLARAANLFYLALAQSRQQTTGYTGVIGVVASGGTELKVFAPDGAGGFTAGVTYDLILFEI